MWFGIRSIKHHLPLALSIKAYTFFFGWVTLLTLFRLFIVSVFKLRGRARPWSLRNSPHALHNVAPNSFRRHNGVVEVPQFWQIGGFPPAWAREAPFIDGGESVICRVSLAPSLSPLWSPPVRSALPVHTASSWFPPPFVEVVDPTIIESLKDLEYVIGTESWRDIVVVVVVVVVDDSNHQD
jgi:hypothetical protein